MNLRGFLPPEKISTVDKRTPEEKQVAIQAALSAQRLAFRNLCRPIESMQTFVEVQAYARTHNLILSVRISADEIGYLVRYPHTEQYICGGSIK